jgi:hypothetical protein
VRAHVLAGLVIPWAPLASVAQATPDSWYLNAEVGGVIPDKPWGARGSAPLYGLDIGHSLAPGWSAELDLTYADLDARRGGGHNGLEGAALQGLRIFDTRTRVAPYVSLGAGLTHEAPGAGSGFISRTEFMVQPGAGALVRLWDTRGGSLGLRAAIEVRWTHGWAHAPGNPVDPIYALGLTYSWGAAADAREPSDSR